MPRRPAAPRGVQPAMPDATKGAAEKLAANKGAN
jgi:hypothetical protein